VAKRIVRSPQAMKALVGQELGGSDWLVMTQEIRGRPRHPTKCPCELKDRMPITNFNPKAATEVIAYIFLLTWVKPPTIALREHASAAAVWRLNAALYQLTSDATARFTPRSCRDGLNGRGQHHPRGLLADHD